MTVARVQKVFVVHVKGLCGCVNPRAHLECPLVRANKFQKQIRIKLHIMMQTEMFGAHLHESQHVSIRQSHGLSAWSWVDM